MMDPLPLYPNLYHPVDTRRTRDYTGIVKPFSRTEHPTRYYLIDFGLSRRYQPEDLPVLEDIIMPGDKTVPEYQGDAEACDPFPVDVYLIGNMIREKFLRVSSLIFSVSDELTNIPPRPTLATTSCERLCKTWSRTTRRSARRWTRSSPGSTQFGPA